MNRSQLGISPSFAVWSGVLWFTLVCNAAGVSYVLRHSDPRYVYLYEHAAMVRSDVLCTYVPFVGALLAIAGLLARRRWGLGLAMLLNLALVAGAFAVTGTAFWLARPYGVDGVILRPEIIGVPTVALLFTLVLLAPSVRRGFRQERDPRLPCGEAGAPSPLRFGADESGASIDRRTRRLIGAPRAPPPPRCAIPPRAPAARLRLRASAARDCECARPPQVDPQFSPGAVATCAGCAPSPARGAEARGETRVEDARRRIAQRGGGGALGAPMRRRGRRPMEAPGSAAPNRSGDGTPASPHCRLGHAPSPTGEVGLASLEGEERRAVLHGGAVLGKDAANQAPHLGGDLVHHLHRLDDAQDLARLDPRADLDERRGIRPGPAVEGPHHGRGDDHLARPGILVRHGAAQRRVGAAAVVAHEADLAAAVLHLELEDAVVPHHADELADLGDVHARGPGPV